MSVVSSGRFAIGTFSLMSEDCLTEQIKLALNRPRATEKDPSVGGTTSKCARAVVTTSTRELSYTEEKVQNMKIL